MKKSTIEYISMARNTMGIHTATCNRVLFVYYSFKISTLPTNSDILLLNLMEGIVSSVDDQSFKFDNLII